MKQVFSLTATAVDHGRINCGGVKNKLPLSAGTHTTMIDVPPANGIHVIVETFPTHAEPPTWKRFRDAPPPDGFYWSRFDDEPAVWNTIVMVRDSLIHTADGELIDSCTDTSREYFSQPILPPP